MSKKRIAIGGWYNPVLDELTVKKIKDCGLDFIFLEGDNIGNNCLDNRLIGAFLGLLDDSGIKAYVQKGNDACIESAVVLDKEYSQHESYLGMLLYDEPSAEVFDSLSKIVKEYACAKSKGRPFINLLPSYARSDSILGNYNAYISEFCGKILKNNSDIDFLSFDFYPLIYGQAEDLCLADRWLHDSYIIAKNAKKYNIQANAFVQAMPFSNNGKKYGSRDRIPTYEDLSLQVYVYLAFGFTGLTYFCLGTPLANFEFSSSAYALLDKNNEQSPTYFHAQKLNTAIHNLSEVYCDYRWVDTKKIGEDELFDFANEICEFSHVDGLNISTDGKLLIGEFEKNDRQKAVMLVNFGEPSQTSVNLTVLKFEKVTDITVYMDGNPSVYKKDSLTLRLNVGEGVFVTYEVL